MCTMHFPKNIQGAFSSPLVKKCGVFVEEGLEFLLPFRPFLPVESNSNGSDYM